MSETVLSARVLRMTPHFSAQKGFNVVCVRVCVCVCVCVSRSVVSNSCNPMDCSPGKSTGEGCHSFSKSMYSNWRQLKCNVICKVMNIIFTFKTCFLTYYFSSCQREINENKFLLGS